MPYRPFAFSLLVAAALASLAFDFVERESDGAGGALLLDGAFGVTASSDGAFVYVAASVDDAITVFARDAASGALTFASATTPDLDALDFAADVVLSPGGEHLYAAGLLSDSVAVFARDAGSGALAFVERLKDGEGDITNLNGARASIVSQDGAHVYVAAAVDNAVVSFERDPVTGALTHLGSARDGQAGVDGLFGAVAITLSPDGAHLYAAGNFDDEIAVFARDGESGALTFVEAEGESIDGPSAVVVSPDGAHAYVANGVGDSLAQFARDPVSGALEFVASIANGIGDPPADGLDGPSEIAITPDGAWLFVPGAGETASTIAAFARDAATGTLQFVEIARDGEGGFEGFANPLGIALADGGASIYVTGSEADAIAVLAPEPAAAAIAAGAVASLAMLARARSRR